MLPTWVLLFAVIAFVNGATYTDGEARKKLTDNGITIVSTGNCNNQDNAHCTSLTGIHSEVIDGTYGIIEFKKKSKCAIQVTGGTEIGHANGLFFLLEQCFQKNVEKTIFKSKK